MAMVMGIRRGIEMRLMRTVARVRKNPMLSEGVLETVGRRVVEIVEMGTGIGKGTMAGTVAANDIGKGMWRISVQKSIIS
jgi:hypothetical protein